MYGANPAMNMNEATETGGIRASDLDAREQERAAALRAAIVEASARDHAESKARMMETRRMPSGLDQQGRHETRVHERDDTDELAELAYWRRKRELVQERRDDRMAQAWAHPATMPIMILVGIVVLALTIVTASEIGGFVHSLFLAYIEAIDAALRT